MRGPSPGLRWSVKRAFLRYIATMPDGRCSVTDGAEVARSNGLDRFQYEWLGQSQEVEAGEEAAILMFRGDVRFAGHHGMLFVRIADPTIVIDGSGSGVLSVLAPEATGEQPDRLPLVRFSLNRCDAPSAVAAVELFRGTDVRLTSEGTDLFGAVYPASEPFDDMDLALPSAALPPCPGGTQTPTPRLAPRTADLSAPGDLVTQHHERSQPCPNQSSTTKCCRH